MVTLNARIYFTRQPRVSWLFTCKLENVRGLLTTLKKIFFWNYAEKHLAMGPSMCGHFDLHLFDTKKLVFRRRTASNIVHPSPIATTVVLSPEVIENEADKGQIEQRVKALTGRTKVEVLAVRKIVEPDGRTRSYEVDIR